MSEVEPRTSRELAREVGIALAGVVVGGTALTTVRSPWPPPVKVGVIVGLLLLLGLGLVLARRRLRRAGRRTIDRSQQRQLQKALRGTGRLPDAADESWRPALRQAVIGNSFAMYFVLYLGFFAFLAFVPDSSDDPDDFLDSPLIVITVVLALGALVGMLAGFLSWVSRLHADNAMKMLEQLDARDTDRADA